MLTLNNTKFFIAAFALITFSLSGCSTKQDIEGEAFVDAGGSAKKLALVSIQVVPEDKFLAHIKKQLPKADEEANKLKASVSNFQKRDAEAQALIAQSSMLQRQSFMMPSMGGMLGAAGALASADNANAASRLAATMSEARSRANAEAEALAGIDTGANPVYFSDKIDGAIFSTESNSEGKFKVSLESGKKVVLVAVKDNLTWVLWLTPDKSKPTITLTNKNLSGAGCNECVFNGKVTPKSIVGGG